MKYMYQPCKGLVMEPIQKFFKRETKYPPCPKCEKKDNCPFTEKTNCLWVSEYNERAEAMEKLGVNVPLNE